MSNFILEAGWTAAIVNSVEEYHFVRVKLLETEAGKCGLGGSYGNASVPLRDLINIEFSEYIPDSSTGKVLSVISRAAGNVDIYFPEG